MTFILFVAVLILGSMLADTRRRLSALERERDERLAAPALERLRAIDSGAAFGPTMAEPAAEPVAPPPPEPVPFIAAPEPETLPASPAISSAVEPEPLPEPSPGPARSWLERARPTGFEDLFGRRLPIWAGGVTLLIAAVLLVKYSIDAGLLSPAVRVMLGMVFGAGLIGGAEAARRLEHHVRDARVAQSLAGAGIGALFAATLAAHNLYDLIGAATAFAGLAAITALAMGLALRFGAPCAVLALVGGLATPAMVQSGTPNVPLLAGYLAMVIGGLSLLSRRQRWFWLGIMALTGGMGWSLLVIAFSALDHAAAVSIGLLVLLIGLFMPLVATEDRRNGIVQAAGAVAAAAQLGLLVATGGYDALSWGLYGLLALAFSWLSGRVPALRPFTTVPLGIGLLLMALWPDPTHGRFAAVMAGHLLIFGGGALWRLWRADSTLGEAGRIALVALGGYGVAIWQLGIEGSMGDASLGMLGLVFAALPALGAALGWARAERQDDLRFPLLALASGLLLIVAGLIGLATWTAPLVVAGICAALLLVAELARDKRIATGALAYLAFSVASLYATGVFTGEFDRLARAIQLEHPVRAALRWGGVALVWSLYAWRRSDRLPAMALTAITAALCYGFVAQIVPAPWLAIAAALIVAALAATMRRLPTLRLMPAMAVLAAISGLWMVEPVGRWLVDALLSLGGVPMLVTHVPAPAMALRQLLLPAALIGLAAWMQRDRPARLPQGIVAAAIGAPLLIGLHCLYKLVFAIDTAARFASHGLAERTVWEVALIVAALGLFHGLKQRVAALALILIGLAHSLVYTLLLHDPLWAAQAVGGWPLVNLLLPAFGLAFAGPRLIARIVPERPAPFVLAGEVAEMLVMLLFAFAMLRQLFIGSLFAGLPVGQVESICWSVLAIALALGWLLWGIRKSAHSWRIGSLVLMLAAVAKVFLIDASGLEGLLRVASFLALGFSLIGIGWLYSRFLRADPAR